MTKEERRRAAARRKQRNLALVRIGIIATGGVAATLLAILTLGS